MRLGIFISELVKVMNGKPLDELNNAEIEDAISKAVRVMKHYGLNCGELSVKELSTLEKVVKVTSRISNFDFLLHELGQYSGTKLSLANEEKRKEVIEGLKTTIDYASDGGIRVITIHPATYNPKEPGYAYSEILPEYLEAKDAWSTSISLLKKISSYASKKDVTLGLENMPFTVLYKDAILKCPHFGITKEQLLKLISDVNNSALRVTFDVGHANTISQPCDYISGMVKFITHIHLHDNDGRYDQHAPLGTGTVNLYFFFRRLKEESYDESIVVERAVDEALFNDLEVLKRYVNEAFK